MEHQNNIPSWLASGVTTLIGATSVEEVTGVILTIVGIVSALFSLAFNIYCWYKKAKEDGKITKEEAKEAVDILNNGIKEINDATKEKK